MPVLDNDFEFFGVLIKQRCNQSKDYSAVFVYVISFGDLSFCNADIRFSNNMNIRLPLDVG